MSNSLYLFFFYFFILMKGPKNSVLSWIYYFLISFFSIFSMPNNYLFNFLPFFFFSIPNIRLWTWLNCGFDIICYLWLKTLLQIKFSLKNKLNTYTNNFWLIIQLKIVFRKQCQTWHYTSKIWKIQKT